MARASAAASASDMAIGAREIALVACESALVSGT
jgi:hypothetical protein